MLTEKVSAGDVLYHSIHGICRVDKIVNENDVVSYSLVPKQSSRMKVRFMIPAIGFEKSGFHKPVNLDEADKIMEYFRKGKAENGNLSVDMERPSFAEENETWALAKAILSFSKNPDMRDSRRRQNISRSVRGLVRELAYVWNLSAKESSEKIRKNLEKTLTLHNTVSDAFFDAMDE